MNSAEAAHTFDSHGVDLTALPRADAIPITHDVTPEFRRVRRIIATAFHCTFRLEVRGVENLPDGACVVIANHLNWADAPALFVALPAWPRLHVIGEVKHIVRKQRLWNTIQKSGGLIPYAGGRRDVALRGQIDEVLEGGSRLLLFPEGTYGASETTVGEFHRGFAHIAAAHGVPIVPVAVQGTSDLWWRKRVTVTIGAPVLPDGESVHTLADKAHAAVEALLSPAPETRGLKIGRRRLTNLFFSGRNR